MGSRSLIGRAILRGKGWPVVKYRDTLRHLCKKADPIEMPFG